MEVVICPPPDAFGFNVKDLIGVVKAKCYICRDAVLRPTSQSRKAKPFCQECFDDYSAMIGGPVDKREITVPVTGIKRSPYRTDR